MFGKRLWAIKIMNKEQCGGCGCGMGGGKTRKTKKDRMLRDIATKTRTRQRNSKNNGKKIGGTVVGDALLAGTALGLYSYFTKKSGGAKMPRSSKLPKRKTKGLYV